MAVRPSRMTPGRSSSQLHDGLLRIGELTGQTSGTIASRGMRFTSPPLVQESWPTIVAATQRMSRQTVARTAMLNFHALELAVHGDRTRQKLLPVPVDTSSTVRGPHSERTTENSGRRRRNPSDSQPRRKFVDRTSQTVGCSGNDPRTRRRASGPPLDRGTSRSTASETGPVMEIQCRPETELIGVRRRRLGQEGGSDGHSPASRRAPPAGRTRILVAGAVPASPP